MSTNRHTLAPCRINNSFNLTQIHSVNVNPNASTDVIVPGGSLNPAAVIMTSAEPTVSVATHDVGTLLTNVGLSTGLSCTSGADFYWQRREIGGTFLGSDSHQKIASTSGFLMVNGLSASQDGPVDAPMTYYPFSSDGETQPLAYTDSASLITAPAFVAKYYMGPVKAGGSFLAGVTGWSYENGMGFRFHPEDGYWYRMRGSIYNRTPTITLNLHSVQALSRFSPDMFVDGTTSLTLFLRLGVSGSHRVADVAATNISIAFATAVWQPTAISASGSDDASVSISATCIGTPTLVNGTAIS